jgi:hypothetical protein
MGLAERLKELKEKAWQCFLRHGDMSTAKADVKEMLQEWPEKGDAFWKELILFHMCHALAVATSTNEPWWEYFQVDDNNDDTISAVAGLPKDITAKQLLEFTQADVVKYTLRRGFEGKSQQRDPYLYRLLRFQSNIFLTMAQKGEEVENHVLTKNCKMLAIICLAKAVHKTLYISIEHKLSLFESLRDLLGQVEITSFDELIVEQLRMGQEFQLKANEAKDSLN